jgi:hypothetical protein
MEEAPALPAGSAAPPAATTVPSGSPGAAVARGVSGGRGSPPAEANGLFVSTSRLTFDGPSSAPVAPLTGRSGSPSPNSSSGSSLKRSTSKLTAATGRCTVRRAKDAAPGSRTPRNQTAQRDTELYATLYARVPFHDPTMEVLAGTFSDKELRVLMSMNKMLINDYNAKTGKYTEKTKTNKIRCLLPKLNALAHPANLPDRSPKRKDSAGGTGARSVSLAARASSSGGTDAAKPRLHPDTTRTAMDSAVEGDDRKTDTGGNGSLPPGAGVADVGRDAESSHGIAGVAAAAATAAAAAEAEAETSSACSLRKAGKAGSVGSWSSAGEGEKQPLDPAAVQCQRCRRGPGYCRHRGDEGHLPLATKEQVQAQAQDGGPLQAPRRISSQSPGPDVSRHDAAEADALQGDRNQRARRSAFSAAAAMTMNETAIADSAMVAAKAELEEEGSEGPSSPRQPQGDSNADGLGDGTDLGAGAPSLASEGGTDTAPVVPKPEPAAMCLPPKKRMRAGGWSQQSSVQEGSASEAALSVDQQSSKDPSQTALDLLGMAVRMEEPAEERSIRHKQPQQEADTMAAQPEHEKITKSFKKSSSTSTSTSGEASASSADAANRPTVSTAAGPIRLGDLVFVKWTEGDGRFYGAEVISVSRSRGVTVRYPETPDWEMWTEVLPIKEITPSRVNFKAPDDAASELPKPTVIEAPIRIGWSEVEDATLVELVEGSGEGDWNTKAARLGTGRSGKACQARYANYLRVFREEGALPVRVQRTGSGKSTREVVRPDRKKSKAVSSATASPRPSAASSKSTGSACDEQFVEDKSDGERMGRRIEYAFKVEDGTWKWFPGKIMAGTRWADWVSVAFDDGLTINVLLKEHTRGNVWRLIKPKGATKGGSKGPSKSSSGGIEKSGLQNQQHRTSQYRGVSWKKSKYAGGAPGQWRAQIQIGDKKRHLGNFANETEAAKAYDDAARATGNARWANFSSGASGGGTSSHALTSRFRGVSWNKGRWEATVTTDGKKHHLGFFDSEESAAMAFNDALRAAGRDEHLKSGRVVKSTSTSKYRGVRWKNGKWEARIRSGGSERSLGRFEDETDAARAYTDAVRQAESARDSAKELLARELAAETDATKSSAVGAGGSGAMTRSSPSSKKRKDLASASETHTTTKGPKIEQQNADTSAAVSALAAAVAQPSTAEPQPPVDETGTCPNTAT